GGTAGAMWVDADGESDWRRLLGDEDAGQVCPVWIDDRIYFISDHEGYGNVYSCGPDGGDLERHTDHTGFYARFLESDGSTLVYSCGGDLYRLDPGTDGAEVIEVDYPSPKTQLNRKFVDASRYLDDYTLHPEGHSLAITSRGKLFNFGHWEGAVRQNGVEQGVRYQMPRYLDDERILALSDESGQQRFEIHPTDGSEAGEPVEVEGHDSGRPLDVAVSPEGDAVALTNHRYEVVHLDLDSGEATQLDRSEEMPIAGLDWSPDGRWVAYSLPLSRRTAQIKVADVQSGESFEVTSGQYRDQQPVFDPQGRYLYFLSARKFTPVYDQVFFELSFPRTMKPCVVTLTDEEDSPFFEEPRPLQGTGGGPSRGDDSEDEQEDGGDEEENGDSDDDDESSEEGVDIDLAGIGSRVETFPVDVAEYSGLAATEKRVFWITHPVEGSLDLSFEEDQGSKGTLKYFSLKNQDEETFARKIDAAEIGPDDKTMVMKSRGRLRIVNAAGRGPAQNGKSGERPSRESGWIDLGRVPVSVQPRQEWGQMLHEAWRLMRDNFWDEEMVGVDWEAVWERYSPLLDRVATRSEFSDLVWTMQGELGTSHAYEMGGDYEHPPQYRPGFLGIDCHWDEEADGYLIDHIVQGATWEEGASSPLDRPGVDVQEGDAIVAINGRELDGGSSLQESLVHRAGDDVEITVAKSDGETETYTVELLRSEFSVRYREWVDRNRRRVHEATDGEIGYVHIPDMGPRGFSEFHRAFVSEQDRTGLIVDVRYNGGGHVSQLILEKLARQTLGYDVTRWGSEPLPYPKGAMLGPTVALTNEYAGSDGDIFSHVFKLMDLGPLLGKRTWGGVVGIWPRHKLVDGSMVTQPEFASWFSDVGYGLENHGTEPDQVIEDPPESQVGESDEQLEEAIREAKERLEEEQPSVPDFGPKPDMSPPEKLE
ncbi:MAG: S41 family peptidase, partial [Bradymonadaceae bacterium]